MKKARVVIVRPDRLHISNAWTVSPKKADGTVEKNHYNITIHMPGRELIVRKASEWGAVSEISEALRYVGEDGKRKLRISITIDPMELINEAEAPAGQGERTDNDEDAMDIIRTIQAMADLSRIYFD